MLPDAWQVGFAPNVLVNWRADGKNQVTFPIGLGAGKTVKRSGPCRPFRRAWSFSGWPGIPMSSVSGSTSRFVFKPVVPALVTKPIFE